MVKAATPWLSVASAGLLATFFGAAVAVWVPASLPLQPLATARPPSDGQSHVLVQVPRGSKTVPAAKGGAAIPAALEKLAADPRVERVSKVDPTTWRVVGGLPARDVGQATGLRASDDVLAKVSATDDTYWPLLWGLENSGGTVGGFPAVADADVDGPEANQSSTGGGIVVAVVDSGIQTDHPDLPRLWQNTRESCGNGVDDDKNGYVDDCSGWDFLEDDATPYDPAADNRHGTHVAGTIAAIPGNGRGTAGLAPGVRLMSLKITDGGSIYLSDAAEAIRYAADQGARVVNASFGTNPGAPREAARVLEDAIAYAGTKGVLVAAAAGNDGVDTDRSPVWPADLPLDNVISVGASTASEQPASFSNYGANSVDLFAPGHYIVSTVDHDGYAAFQGTSMATPHVAAVAALMLSKDSSLSPLQVRERLVATADRHSGYANRSVAGGRLNANEAVRPSAAAKVTVEAASFDTFAAGQEHTGTLTIRAEPDLFRNDSQVTWRGRLLASVAGSVHVVVDQVVRINGESRTTDGKGGVLLGPAAGVRMADSTLDDEGVRVAFSSTLPSGQYALVVDVVAASDNQYGYGPPVAVFFSVAGADSNGPAESPSGQTGPATPPTSGGTAPTAPTAPNAGSTPPTSGGGSSPPAATTPPSSGGGGWTPPSSGGGWTPPSSGGGWTPPSSGGGWTPPSSGGGWTPPSSGGGWTPPSSGGGWTPPGSGDGGTQPAPGSSAPAPVTHDGITILAVSPSQGSATGGDTLMIFGLNFPDYPVVTVGGAPASVRSGSFLSLTVTTPSGVPGSRADVTVADRSGHSVTLPGGYLYLGTGSSPSQPDTSPGGQQPSSPGNGGSGNPGGTWPGTQQPAVGQPNVPGTAPTAPGSPTVPGTSPNPAPSPSPGQPVPGSSQPVASPGASAAGPAGTVFRPDPQVGAVISWSGLRLAPVTADNPIPSATPTLWANWACTRVMCEGFPV